MATRVRVAEDGSETLDGQIRMLPMADTPASRGALAEANVQTLLMTYLHLTHDPAMLELR